MDITLIALLVVVMGGMMWWQSKKSKEQRQKVKDFRANLQPGTEVITIGQIIGKVVSVDEQYEEIVIDSEGTLLRFSFNGISKEYVRPAYVSDDEVDENGNPVDAEADADTADSETDADAAQLESGQAQVPVEESLAADAAETDAAETDEAETAKEAK